MDKSLEINMGVLDDLYGDSEPQDLELTKIKSGLEILRRRRATHKRKITIYCNKLKLLHTSGTLSSSLCKKQVKEIEEELSKLQEYNEVINTFMQQTDLGNKDEENFNFELDSQAEYSVNILIDLDLYEDYLIENKDKSPNIITSSISEILSDGKPPPLLCGTFSGTERDKFAFPNFMNQFSNIIGSKKNLTESAKLSYLLGYLKGYALKQISHLSITNENYQMALKLLNEEFLDKAFIIDETLKNILKAVPRDEYDPEFTNVKYFICEVRSYLYELQQYNVDFLEDNTAGNILVSHLVMNKLPKIVVKEVISRTNNNYPSLKEIFDNYKEALKTLSRTRTVPGKRVYKDSKIPNKQPSALQAVKAKMPTVQNYEIAVNKNAKILCKLCESDGHTIGKCEAFPSYESKIARIMELSLCTRCAGSGHKEFECFGKQGKLRFQCFICKKREHITPLCPNRSKSHSNSNAQTHLCYTLKNVDICNILPTMTLALGSGKRRRKVRCLVDCGSQRSYITKEVSKDLCYSYDELYELEQDVCTYIGQETKNFKQMSTGIRVNDRLVFVPLLVDDKMKISYDVPGMNIIVNKLKSQNVKLADESYYQDNNNHESIEIEMLVGMDIIQYFSLEVRKVCGGFSFIINGKVAPVGNVFNFLNSVERKVLFDSRLRNPDRVNNVSNKTKTMVNLIMDPLKSYFNPLEHILTDSEVDNGLENLFNFESIGIKNSDQELVSFDKQQIGKFKEGIQLKDGHYHVNLPWYEDKIDKVPSNSFIALKVLDRTVEHLNKKGLVSKYEEVFDKQLEDGIIEEINVSPSDYDHYTWIPHRPVIRTEEQVTTKIRPVFNCSLKTSKELPSLNEAAYTGIDLMGSILKLLFYLRTNKYAMLSDIKQAFLMIKLDREYDKNRFCFFWKRGNRLVCYRYKTIVFGYTSSPFILNYVMKHHVENYPQDKCSQILNNNFYVDNLIVTGNDVEELHELYEHCFNRMQEGGFTLRSWNSNSVELRRTMKAEGKLVEHDCEEDKVLGYRYNINKDTLSLAPCSVEETADTKRKVLSQISKVFDPLNFTLPVTIRGRILMRKVWKLELEWDQKVPKEISNEMKSISKDFGMLPELSFPRYAINDQCSYGLHIFCDSSKDAYGFVMYACSNENKSSFLFAKSKLAPLRKGNEHSVPTLELMGVILALKCLPTLLEIYSNIQFQFVNICVDAQVVLNWVITKEPKVKSKFVRNRILEVDGLISRFEEEFKLPITYRYVHTEQNPADLLTKGLSYNKYLQNRKLWLEGPDWLTNEFDKWPKYPLMSISPEHKNKINVNYVSEVIKVNTGILDIDKFSSYEKLLKITSYLFKFLCKLKGGNPLEKAKKYWIKVAQTERYSKEIAFLKSDVKNDKHVPTLVSNLNLFLDENEIVRSRGRISKCLYFDYEVYNPVLLPKGHKLTSLYINYCHARVQHMGTGTTLNYLREQGVWIPKGLSAVKSEISNCLVCRKYNALAYKYPKVVDMPKHHMNLVRPFNHVGVDYTGHLWVKDEISGGTVKMFVLVFTCLNIRAVHFELLPDMSTRNFVLAFQRLCNMYSIPQFLYSDNAKTFLKGGSILETSLESKEFQDEMEKCGIRHIRIPLYSAWVGSAWERLIRVLKNCLFKAVGRSRLTYFELLTTLSNIKLAINSRPLTYRSSTANLEFITPNSFLKLHGNSALILRKEEEDVWQEEQDPSSLERTLDVQGEIINNFKSLWYDNYLLSLREHSRNVYQSKWENRIKVGDIVLIKAINKARPFWMMGKVLELVIGFDNKVRSVKLKQGNGAIEYHSISNLYPMEISVNQVEPQTRANEEDSVSGPVDRPQDNEAILGGGSVQPVSDISVRPKRKATERFRRMMRDRIDDL